MLFPTALFAASPPVTAYTLPEQSLQMRCFTQRVALGGREDQAGQRGKRHRRGDRRSCALRPTGQTYQGLCPFHDDHRPPSPSIPLAKLQVLELWRKWATSSLLFKNMSTSVLGKRWNFSRAAPESRWKNRQTPRITSVDRHA